MAPIWEAVLSRPYIFLLILEHCDIDTFLALRLVSKSILAFIIKHEATIISKIPIATCPTTRYFEEVSWTGPRTMALLLDFKLYHLATICVDKGIGGPKIRPYDPRGCAHRLRWQQAFQLYYNFWLIAQRSVQQAQRRHANISSLERWFGGRGPRDLQSDMKMTAQILHDWLVYKDQLSGKEAYIFNTLVDALRSKMQIKCSGYPDRSKQIDLYFDPAIHHPKRWLCRNSGLYPPQGRWWLLYYVMLNGPWLWWNHWWRDRYRDDVVIPAEAALREWNSRTAGRKERMTIIVLETNVCVSIISALWNKADGWLARYHWADDDSHNFIEFHDPDIERDVLGKDGIDYDQRYERTRDMAVVTESFWLQSNDRWKMHVGKSVDHDRIIKEGYARDRELHRSLNGSRMYANCISHTPNRI